MKKTPEERFCVTLPGEGGCHIAHGRQSAVRAMEGWALRADLLIANKRDVALFLEGSHPSVTVMLVGKEQTWGWWMSRVNIMTILGEDAQ